MNELTPHSPRGPGPRLPGTPAEAPAALELAPPGYEAPAAPAPPQDPAAEAALAALELAPPGYEAMAGGGGDAGPQGGDGRARRTPPRAATSGCTRAACGGPGRGVAFSGRGSPRRAFRVCLT